MPYESRDLELVSIAATQPSVLVVPATLGVNSADELVALMKKNPGKYNYSSMGAGSISHLAMEALAAKSGTSVVHVPYAGSGPAVTALLSGNADIAVLPAAAVVPHIKAGKIKGRRRHGEALRGAARSAHPAESGLTASGRRLDGLIVPAKTPDSIVRPCTGLAQISPPPVPRKAQSPLHGRGRQHAAEASRLARTSSA